MYKVRFLAHHSLPVCWPPCGKETEVLLCDLRGGGGPRGIRTTANAQLNELLDMTGAGQDWAA